MSVIFRRKISLRELFEELELPQMEMPEADEHRIRGRPQYPDEPMLIPFGAVSENELARKLAEILSLSEDCGFEKKRTSGLKRSCSGMRKESIIFWLQVRSTRRV